VAEILDYSSCSQTLTATATLNIGSKQFYADPFTFEFAEVNVGSLLFITWHYPSVSLSTLTPLETLTFVRIDLYRLLNFRLNHLAAMVYNLIIGLGRTISPRIRRV
jgi:hypothetical protein